MTGWIFALAALTPPAPPVQLRPAATAIIVQMERIDPAKARTEKQDGRQTRHRNGGMQIDFY